VGIEPVRDNKNVVRVPVDPARKKEGMLFVSIPKDSFQPSGQGAEAFQERLEKCEGQVRGEDQAPPAENASKGPAENTVENTSEPQAPAAEKRTERAPIVLLRSSAADL
jgi:hypothetical protein